MTEYINSKPLAINIKELEKLESIAFIFNQSINDDIKIE